MKFIRSNLVKDLTISTGVLTRDLPTNPLSHLVISIDGLNVTDEATLAEILAFINSIQVTNSGATIYNLQSEDIYAQNVKLFGHYPVLTGSLATDNYARCLTLIVPFGRKIFNPAECLFAAKKGDLTLRCDLTIPATSFDVAHINIETVELPDANPSKYLRSVVKVVSAPGATGENEVDLPIGNELVALGLRLTTIPTTSSTTYGVDNARLLVDNVEYGYASARAQCLQGEAIFHSDGRHGAIAAQGIGQCDNVLWMDYDPVGDGNFLLDTAGASRVHLNLDMGVDEATNINVMELVKI